MKNHFFNIYSIVTLSCIFLVQSFNSQAQESKRADNWHFGTRAGINFACTPYSFAGSELVSSEGSASISDTDGNLLFYTDGQNVWDRNNTLMPNGTGLLGNISTVQSAVIIPHPGNSSHYFIFTAGTSLEDNGTIGVRFSEVDMNLNAGNGDVLVANKNTLLFLPNEEKLTAVENAAGNGYWVTAQEKSTNIWHSYEVTAAGVNMTPVTSITGPGARPNNSLGAKFSPDGTMLVSQAGCPGGNPVQPNWNANLVLYSFDNATGQLTYLWGDCGAPGFNVEFSPDCTKLYASGVQMFQYDLAAGTGIDDSTAIIASKTQLTTSNWTVDALQLANNCKIYVAEGGTAIGEIRNPNAAGLACDYVPGAFTLTSGTTGNRFPNFVQSFFNGPCTNLQIEIIGNDASCVNDGEATVNVIQGQPNYSYLWSTGDITQTISNIGGGWYTVEVSDDSGCTVTDSILINQPQTISIDGALITNASACGASDGAIDLDLSVVGTGTPTMLLEEGFETDGHSTRYTANPYPGTPSGTVFFKRGDDASIDFSTNPTNEEGDFYFGARRTGFSGLPAVCDVTTNPTNIAGYSDLEICALLALGRNNMNVAANNHMTIEYNIDGSGWITLASFRPPGGTFSTGLAEDTNNDGVGDGTPLSTTFQDFCYQIPATGNDIQIRISTDMSGSSLRQSAFDYIRVQGVAPYSYTVLWSTTETTEDISNLTEGTYDVTITGQNGCVVEESFTISDPCAITASFTMPTNTICQGDNITFTDNSSGIITSWDWTFNAGSPNTANTQGPHNITFNTPGSHDITLQVSDGVNTEDTTITVFVNPTSTFVQNPVICQGDNIVVGSSTYTSSGNYTDVLTNSFGCDSIVTTNLTVNPSATGTDIQNACGDFTWIDGVTYNSSTNTPTFTIVGGAANGCDSIVTLDLTISTFVTGTDIQTACGDYTWIDGVTYNSSTNTPTFTIVGGAVNGCDSIVTLDLTINNNVTGTDIQAACGDFTWIDGVTYTSSTNTPTFTIIGGAANGCDSIVTLDLTIDTFVTGTDIQTACEDFTWIDGVNYTSSTNTPTFTIVGGSANGCDSIVTLDLTINNIASGTDVQTVCGDFTWIDGVTYTSSTNTPTFTIVGGAANGCDSIVTLDLTINNNATSTDVQTACGDFTWIDGVNYTSSTNTPTFTIVGGAANGCDSIVTLDLTINNIATSTDIQTACGDFTWIDGVNYTSSTNTPTFTIVGGAVNGCDSIVTLDLTINNNVTGTDVQVVCEDFTWIDGVNYTSSTNTPTFTIVGGAANGCDSIVTLDLTINTPSTTTNTYNECEGFSITVGTNTYNTSGVYTDVVNGCDTIITDLTINPSPTLTLIKTDENCGEENGSVSAVANSSNPPITYSWSTGSTDSTIDGLISGTYTVIVSDESGCSVTDTIDVLDVQIDCDYFVYLPNGFTPNGDQNNDILYVRGKGIASFTLNIYNRWGNKVFETNEFDTGWDGTYKGEPQNTAVFVYTIEGVFENGNTFKESGDISLMR